MNKFQYYLRGLETLIYLFLVCVSVGIGFAVQVVILIFAFPVLLYDRYFFHKLGNRVVFITINLVSFFINPHWRCVILTDLPRRDPKKRKIYMFNHIGLADAFVTTFIGKTRYTACLYKDSLHKGYPKVLLNLIGQVPIYFEYDHELGTKRVKKECIPKVMERCRVLMENGFDLFVYPEGTRTKTGKLQEFKDGFFRFAVEHGYEVVPCAIHNTANALSKDNFALDALCYLMVGTPVSPKGKTVEELKFEVRKKVYQLLKLSPKFDPDVETVEELE